MIVKAIKQTLLSAIILTMTISCLPEDLLIEVRPAESQLVVSSINIDTLGLAVFVTRSFSALEGNEDSLSEDFINQIVVRNADITLTIDNQIITLDSIEDVPGIYFTDELAIMDNQLIRLDVFDPKTNKSVYAETTVIPAIALDTAGLLEEIIDEDTIQHLFYSFTDPENNRNWYSLNVFDPFAFADDVGENIFSLNGGNSGVIYGRLIADQTFTEPVYRDTVRLFEPIASDTIAFFFTNVSEGYFRFLDVRQRFGGIISDSEPVNFPTNVVGGLGYFTFNKPRIKIVTKTSKD